MSAPLFPFTAMAGLESLKLALQLAAIDPQLSVLARGDRGAGKSTAARALGTLLAPGAPFVNVPIGATEDRLLGGLDIERAMKGEPALKPGLVSQAHGGVLYIDEVNLLPDHLADALLDLVASGIHVLEREGFSSAHDARFVLVGSMNPEEGALRPQLLDRFALSVDVAAPTDAAARREIVERRLRFDAGPAAFAGEWRDRDAALRDRLARARVAVPQVECPADVLDYVANAICERRVRSMRADLATIRASRARAALQETGTVTRAHVDEVLPLVLGHRSPAPPPRSSPPPSSPPPDTPESESPAGASAAQSRIFEVAEMSGPRLVSAGRAAAGRAAAVDGARRGVVTHSRPSQDAGEIDVRASVVHALARTGSARPNTEDLHENVRAPIGGRRFLFVVDASGSQAVQQRMRFVKGAVAAMLTQSAQRHDEVVLIAFRGPSASVVLPPTRSVDEAMATLAYLPTGGRTPLAHGLELAAEYVNDRTTLVLLTDGHANVGSKTDDGWADALQAASRLACPALVVDSESGANTSGRAKLIADALGAAHVRLDEMDESSILRLVGLKPDTTYETRS